MEFKKFFFIVTAGHAWGRGNTLEEAYKATHGCRYLSKPHHVIYVGCVDEKATLEEVTNLKTCWNVDDWGTPRFYTDPSPEDQAMLDNLFKGWIVEEMNKPKPPKKKVN